MIKWLVFKASPKKASKMAIPIRRRSLIGPKMKAIEGRGRTSSIFRIFQDENRGIGLTSSMRLHTALLE
jgi:hypothetical protein